MIFGYYDHTHHPDTGRPEPDESWPRETALIWTAWVGVSAMVALAAYRYITWGDGQEAQRLLGAMALLAPFVALRHLELSAKKRAWREALAAYEAAQADAAPVAQ